VSSLRSYVRRRVERPLQYQGKILESDGSHWRDPEFDVVKPAIYYARVLEIPTPRWSTLVAVKNHLPLSPYVAPTIQERAWSFPIWYTPAKSPATR
jgi:hypothetical protein